MLSAGALLFGLDLGAISLVALLGVGAWQVLSARPTSDAGVTGRLATGLLVAAISSYYLIATIHGQYDAGRAAGYLATCLLAHLVGMTASGARDGELMPNVLVGYVFATLGAATYAWLSARQGLEIGTDFATRAAPSAWEPANLITGTALGASAAPGLALLAALLFAAAEERSVPWRVAGWAAALAGLLANAMLLNRAPFLAAAVATAACAWIFLRAPEVETGRKTRRMAALSIVTLTCGAWAYSVLGDAEVSIVARFESEGVSTARWQLLWEVLSQVLFHPFGGRAFTISENYAHNLWLDVGYDAGPIPMLLLLAFHAIHVPAVVRVIRHHPSLNARLVTMAGVVAFAFTGMAEPVLIMSVPHFSLGLLLLGGLLRVAASLPAPAPESSPGAARVDAPAEGATPPA